MAECRFKGGSGTAARSGRTGSVRFLAGMAQKRRARPESARSLWLGMALQYGAILRPSPDRPLVKSRASWPDAAIVVQRAPIAQHAAGVCTLPLVSHAYDKAHISKALQVITCALATNGEHLEVTFGGKDKSGSCCWFGGRGR